MGSGFRIPVFEFGVLSVKCDSASGFGVHVLESRV